MRPLAVRDEGSIAGRSGLKNRASEQRDDFSVNRKPKGRRFLSFSRNQEKQSHFGAAVFSLWGIFQFCTPCYKPNGQ